MSVGLNIKKRRYELGMSQQELAEAMGYKTRSTIAKIEAGTNDVSQKKLQRFANVLDTSVDTLVSSYTSTPLNTTGILATSTMHRDKNIAIILAGGKLSRNRQNIPNQFVTVHGKPIIIYCAQAYQMHPSIDHIYIVCLKGWEDILQDYALQYGITKLKGIIPAGSSGIISLKNAIDHIKDQYSPNDVIFIQESTRPVVSTEAISKLLQTCIAKNSATLCRPMADRLQFDMSSGKPSYVDRNALIEMQSPEAHRLFLLTELFDRTQKEKHELYESCCTMLLYNMGYDINFIESNFNNIKISYEEDVATFDALINQLKQMP
ncbi:MAG: 2-C-methyl-D-erythritol 4-phosphate cytidylyltransferase [Lachnospiraceae bacterium]|nr:2-C-methyl-D-erythritol 4-phosphate cytidylyltransferase [Lachnospiraceae bacterium]